MGGFSNFAISFSIISILTGAVTLYSHGLVMGGPAEMAFGWPLVSVFTLTVALSMAELASSMPTSGAMYHWACRLGGKGWGWFTAWFNIIGQLATLAGIDYGCALFVTPLIGVPTTTANVLIVYAVVLGVARRHQSRRHQAGGAAERSQRHRPCRRRGRDRRRLVALRAEAADRLFLCPHHVQHQRLAVLVGVRRRSAAGAVDVHRLRRVGERVGRNRGPAAPRAVGHRDGGRGLERGGLPAADGADPRDSGHSRRAERAGRRRPADSGGDCDSHDRARDAGRRTGDRAGRDGDVVLRPFGGDVDVARDLCLRAGRRDADVRRLEAREPRSTSRPHRRSGVPSRSRFWRPSAAGPTRS